MDHRHTTLDMLTSGRSCVPRIWKWMQLRIHQSRATAGFACNFFRIFLALKLFQIKKNILCPHIFPCHPSTLRHSFQAYSLFFPLPLFASRPLLYERGYCAEETRAQLHRHCASRLGGFSLPSYVLTPFRVRRRFYIKLKWFWLKCKWHELWHKSATRVCVCECVVGRLRRVYAYGTHVLWSPHLTVCHPFDGMT